MYFLNTLLFKSIHKEHLTRNKHRKGCEGEPWLRPLDCWAPAWVLYSPALCDRLNCVPQIVVLTPSTSQCDYLEIGL